MSSITFGGTVSMSTISTPSNGWLIGYDTDGILKQKDQFGIITDIKEVISEEKSVAYLFTNPQKVTINKPFLVSEQDNERSYEITFSQWMLLSADKEMAVPTNYVVTIVEPLDSVKEMYSEKINGTNSEVSSTQE